MRVLVALDGSSEEPLAAIAGWAGTALSDAYLFIVLDPDKVHGSRSIEFGPVPAHRQANVALETLEVEPHVRTLEDRTQALARREEEALDNLRLLGRRYLPGLFEVRASWSRHPAQAIAAAAVELDADVITVGTHTRGGLSYLVAGSVAEEVIRLAHVPVLVVRRGLESLSDTSQLVGSVNT